MGEIRGTKLYEATACFQTKYGGLLDLNTDLQAKAAIVTLLGLDVSTNPPTAAQLYAAKTAWDALRNVSMYEGCTLPAMADTSLWAEIKAEAEDSSATTNTSERYTAYWALKTKIADLLALRTAIYGDTAIAAVAGKALDAGAYATSAELVAAKTAWDALRNVLTYGYGGCFIPAVNVNAALWTEIAADAASSGGE